MSRQQYSHGFTLIEILVVVIIIATISSLALMSMSLVGDDRELDRERRRLASLIEVAQDEATMQGRELGVELLRSGYRFVEFDPFTSRWSAVAYDDLFRLRQLPEGMEFELYIEDKRVILARDPELLEEPDDDDRQMGVTEYLPHLHLSASGESTGFELRLRRVANNQELFMRGDILGNIEFNEAEE